MSKKIKKILIGTPIHQVKDYSMERWLKSVSELEYPADFLMVDNSPGYDYVEKVKDYCRKYNITNYKLEHLEINQELGADQRIGRSREIVRQEILSKDYDAWFSWECDQILPPHTLGKLIELKDSGNFMMVSHNSWTREIPNQPMNAFGCALIGREPLEKYGFLLEYPDMPDCWHAGDVWFKKQILKGGGNYIEVSGIIKPIYHLEE